MFFKILTVTIITICTSFTNGKHPLFVSVTEIEYNAKEKSIEISCKIFTDDFEKTLRAAYKTKVDLLNAILKPSMDKLVNDYLSKHLKLNIDGKLCTLKYIGFEKIEEGIYCYFEIENIVTPKKITITNDVLYEYNATQMGLIHVIVGGKRQSKKLVNPDKLLELDL